MYKFGWDFILHEISWANLKLLNITGSKRHEYSKPGKDKEEKEETYIMGADELMLLNDL